MPLLDKIAHRQIVPFLLIFAVVFIGCLFTDNSIGFDNIYYWGLGKNIFQNRLPNFTNIDNGWRGYFFPLCLGLCYKLYKFTGGGRVFLLENN